MSGPDSRSSTDDVEQSLPFGCVDRVEELVAEVVGDQMVVAMEGRDELGHVAVASHRERSQYQPGSPTLGSTGEPRDVVGVETHDVGVEQPRRLVDVEPQVGGADLGDLVSDTEPSETERWIETCRHDDDAVPRSSR